MSLRPVCVCVCVCVSVRAHLILEWGHCCCKIGTRTGCYDTVTLLWLPPRSRDITGGCGGWYLEETSSDDVCVCVLVRELSQVQCVCT